MEDAIDYVSIQEIVNGDYGLENTIFKIKRHDEPSEEVTCQNLLRSRVNQEPQNLSASLTEKFVHSFVSMQIKKLFYLGKPAVAVYIRDKTKRVREKLLRMKA